MISEGRGIRLHVTIQAIDAKNTRMAYKYNRHQIERLIIRYRSEQWSLWMSVCISLNDRDHCQICL